MAELDARMVMLVVMNVVLGVLTLGAVVAVLAALLSELFTRPQRKQRVPVGVADLVPHGAGHGDGSSVRITLLAQPVN